MAQLIINDKRNASKPSVYFADLPVGEVFEDKENYLCIKTNFSQCLFYNGDEWDFCSCDNDEIVFPLKVTLTIDGRE